MPFFNNYHLKSVFTCEQLNGDPLERKKNPLNGSCYYEQENSVCATAAGATQVEALLFQIGAVQWAL